MAESFPGGAVADHIDAQFERFLERYDEHDGRYVSTHDLADYLRDVRDSVAAALAASEPVGTVPREAVPFAFYHIGPLDLPEDGSFSKTRLTDHDKGYGWSEVELFRTCDFSEAVFAPAPAAGESVEAVAWPEPVIAWPDIANPTGVPYLNCLLHRLLDAQQDVNLAANEGMDQSLADVSALMDEIERAIRLAARSIATLARLQAPKDGTDALAARVAELEAENAALAADQCHDGYGDAWGNHRCGVVEGLKSQLADANKRLASAEVAIAAQPDALADGWLYYNPDAGTEWAENHPVESGEVIDAEDVRAATAAVLREELLSAWEALAAAEKRAKRQPDALAGSVVGDGVLREAVAVFFEAMDAEPEKDCWDTETGEEEEGAQKFSSDWAWNEHETRIGKAREALRSALASHPPATGATGDEPKGGAE